VHSTRFSATGKGKTKPSAWRSSGTCAEPNSVICLGENLVISSPKRVTLPDKVFCKPVIALTNSVWPFPCTPAIPTISPEYISSETSSTTMFWNLSATVRFSTEHTSSPGLLSVRSTSRSTARPTIMAANVCLSAWAGVVSPTIAPRRITMTRSEISITSRSLCVIKMIDLPWATSDRMILNNSSASCGVRTAVGSSKIRISASR